MNILDEQLSDLLKNTEKVAQYREAMRLLRETGLFDILRRIGMPSIVDDGENLATMAGQAHYSNGYQTCLDHILYLERLFSVTRKVDQIPVPMFNGLQQAVREGKLTSEEAGIMLKAKKENLI